MIFIFLAVWTAMHAYVFSRAASVPILKSHIPHGVLIGLAIFLWTSYILGRNLTHNGLPAIGSIFEHIGAAWIGLLFLLLVCMFAVDVATGFGFFFRTLVPTLQGCALLAGVLLAIIATGQALRAPVVREYEVRMQNLPAESDGMVVVAASDTHVGALLGLPWLQDRIAQVQSLKPDLILLVGDIVEGDEASQRKLLPGLKGFSAPLGVWAVTGNHEYYAGVDHCVAVLDKAGIHVLRDRWTELRPGLLLAGVDDLTTRRRSAKEKDLISPALAGRPPGATILMSHTPWETEEAARAGVGLMLSGHTHNGQIWPFTYLVKLVYPQIYGDYMIGGMTLIVCRGTGTWGPRMRLWNRSELLRITLRKA
jgi:predicted MPP superfamily phosphohydrolase